MNSKDVLVTGGDGVLGSYCSFGTRLSRSDLNITDLNAVMNICAERRPKVIVHCAALVDLSSCEKNPEKAYLVNSVGTYHLALGARSVGAKLVYISTSDVFDGGKSESYTEKDVPNPTPYTGVQSIMGACGHGRSRVHHHAHIVDVWGGPKKVQNL